jgi:selenide,water dikinase
MGGVPKTALSVLAFPSESLDGQLMYHLMKGAMDVLAEAGVALIGGHSIKDEEIKLGFAITGTIEPDRLARRDALTVGDRLVLTKPLGVGVLNFARQIGRPVDFTPAEAVMAQMNREAAEAMAAVGATGCTDVTGFGLFGHLVAMVRSAGMTAQVWADTLPALDGALDAFAEEIIPGAIERNREFVADDLSVADGVPDERVALGFDAQTSGGLLIAVAEDRLQALLDELQQRGVSGWVIGRIIEASEGYIAVTQQGQTASAAPAVDQSADLPAHDGPDERGSCCDAEADSSSCCSSALPVEPCCGGQGAAGQGASTAGASAKAFGEMMRSANAPGLLDERTKELIAFALVVQGRCEPCFRAHWQKAMALGISRAELDEVAWSAAAMGGAVVRMFYKEMLEQVDESTGRSCC